MKRIDYGKPALLCLLLAAGIVAGNVRPVPGKTVNRDARKELGGKDVATTMGSSGDVVGDKLVIRARFLSGSRHGFRPFKSPEKKPLMNKKVYGNGPNWIDICANKFARIRGLSRQA